MHCRYAWLDAELRKRGHESICDNWPDPHVCHQSIWLAHVRDELKADENTVIVGHSTGALLAMRLLETTDVYGAILVAAAHTDLDDPHEKASGYFETEWDWEAMKSHAQFIHQFHSSDDHLIPVSEARFVAERLQGENHEYEELAGYSHFFEPFQPLLDCVDKHCPTK